jgi:adhesin transport system outer membrane protein
LNWNPRVVLSATRLNDELDCLGGQMRIFLGILFAGVVATSPAAAKSGFSIVDAILQAVQTNPGVGEAAANRRATETELRQNQGTLLPQVRVEAEIGPQRMDRHITPTPLANRQWVSGRQASVAVRQLLYDGFFSINEIWRQAARVDAAAARVHERTELIALDAAEAYIDVTRYLRLIELANRNVQTHRGILGNVRARFEGGRTGEGDLSQAQERVASTEAVLAEFRQRLDDARGAYRNAVGLEPFNVSFPGRLRGLPPSKDDALAVTLRHNPTIQAAGLDVKAAKHGFDATAGQFGPSVSLEGRALAGVNTGNLEGHREEYSGKVVLSWDIFTGGQTSWRRAEAAERMVEQTERHARLQRDAFESIDKAWAARTITADRVAALNRQVDSARKVVGAYSKEYELGQRTLIDLLNAENQLFNALVQLVSTQGVAVFADYQLLAAMGKLLEYLKAPQPAEAEPLPVIPFGLMPTKLPPVILRAPGPGPEPLSTFEPMPQTGALWPLPAAPATTKKVAVENIQQLWPQAPTAVAGTQPGAPKSQQAEAKQSDGHFPFASAASEASSTYWPTTALSYAPTVAGATTAIPGR